MYSTVQYKGCLAKIRARLSKSDEPYIIECSIDDSDVTFCAKDIAGAIEEFKKHVDSYKLSGCW